MRLQKPKNEETRDVTRMEAMMKKSSKTNQEIGKEPS